MTEAMRDLGSRVPRIAALYRLQWEDAQQCHVLLFPEGMIKLNRSAGEILRRCNGACTAEAIIRDLEVAFGATALRDDVFAFLELAAGKRWIEWTPP